MIKAFTAYIEVVFVSLQDEAKAKKALLNIIEQGISNGMSISKKREDTEEIIVSFPRGTQLKHFVMRPQESANFTEEK